MKTKASGFFLVLSIITGAIFLTASFSSASHQHALGQRQSVPVTNPTSDKTQIAAMAVLQLPLYFIPNQGQLDPQVSFYLHSCDKSIYFSPGGVTFALNKPVPSQPYHEIIYRNIFSFGDDDPAENQEASPSRWSRWVVKLDFVDVSNELIPVGQQKTEAMVSYFRGKPENWLTGLPTYARVYYRQLWPGVDLSFSGDDSRLKYEFAISPGADPSTIRLRYRGASEVYLNEKGQLVICTPAGSFVDNAPVAYQLVNGQKVYVPVRYEVLQKKVGTDGLVSLEYTFHPDSYDRTRVLYIDPAILVYSGYLGGSSNDRALAIAVDGVGNAYITGWTGSYDFPVAAGPDLTFNGPALGTDAFVAKINAAGTEMVYCGFLGGTYDDSGTGIAVDSAGNVYVCGYTKSPDFPVVIGPYISYQGNIVQYGDAFITKINAAGTALVYSGFLGGSAADLASSVAVDSLGRAFVCGTTESSDFPTRTGPDLTYNGLKDVFVLRVAASGAQLEWSGFLGGTNNDIGNAIALDTSGNVYVTGYTASTQGNQFPVKNGPKLTHSGGLDAFVAKVSSSGSSLVYCGYIGGISDDYGSGLAVDSSGNAFITGVTFSATGFPVTAGPDLSYNGGADAFVAKVSSSGTGLDFCGFVGGSADDFGIAIAVDASGIIYLAGSTESANFPVAESLHTYLGNRDAFVSVLQADAQGFYFSTFLGGSDLDEANGVVADGTGNIFVAGFTRSPDFPVLNGPYLIPGGGTGYLAEDAFMTRIYAQLPPLAPANLRLVNITDVEADLAWDDRSSNEEGFKIERKTGAGGTWSQIATVGANVTTFKNSGLNEASNYYYRVKAYNSIGDSPYSNELSVLTRPAAPTNLVATAVNERKINLSWTDNSNGETGFRLEKKTENSSWSVLATLAANVTSYSDTSVVENTTYTYRVFAFNDSGDSASSNEETVTTPALTIPAAPSDLVAQAMSASQVRLSWVDNSYNEDGFKVERKTGEAGTWAQVGVASADSTSFLDNSVSELTTYYYRIKAYNSAGDSSYSNEAMVTTPENKPKLRLPIAEVIFGQVNVCSSAEKTTVLYNDGGGELLVSGITRSSGSSDFTYAGPATPFTVPPFGSRTITVRFAPGTVGPVTASFTVNSNDPDNPAATFSASGDGFIPVITINLNVERRTERAWIIRRDYAQVTVLVTKEAPYQVAKYRLWRKVTGGSYELRKEFSEVEFSSNRLVYVDKYLDKGKNYLYRVEALDCFNRVISTSDEVGTQATQTLKKNQVRKPGKIGM
ncbi:MAG: SBBP repeat-containing protein [Candidatus Aminicenantes bacterium]|nr:SBBP repeat-containing protein [Candidatus Aminicenantes bacterium]